MTIAIIIGRGGSKRLPRKNVLRFCEHPLIAWSIVQAKCSHRIDWVYVSTDDDEIAAVSREYGAEVIRRPEWHDADLVSANRPYRHAMKELLMEYGEEFNTAVTILPTSPLKRPQDMDLGIKLAHDYGLQEVIPISKRRETMIYRVTHPFTARTVFLDKGYHFAGPGASWNVCNPRGYIAFTEAFSDLDHTLDDRAMHHLEESPRLDVSYIEVPLWQQFEVDTQEEWALAEVLMEHYILKGKGPEVYYEYAGRKNHE